MPAEELRCSGGLVDEEQAAEGGLDVEDGKAGAGMGSARPCSSAPVLALLEPSVGERSGGGAMVACWGAADGGEDGEQKKL